MYIDALVKCCVFPLLFAFHYCKHSQVVWLEGEGELQTLEPNWDLALQCGISI